MRYSNEKDFAIARRAQRPVVDGEFDPLRGRARQLSVFVAWSALLGLLVYNVGWFVGGLAQGAGYSVVRDDISELSALTARHAWLMVVGNGICGVTTIAFAVIGFGSCVPAVRGQALSAAMIAGSALGLDALSDVFFRLNCQTADGCTQLQEIASWHGVVHAVVGVITFLVLMAGPFVVARTLRRAAEWNDLARWSVILGVAIDLALASAWIPGWAGAAQRLGMTVGSLWIGLLAVRVLRLGYARMHGRRPAPRLAKVILIRR
jgi:hypothetical protein